MYLNNTYRVAKIYSIVVACVILITLIINFFDIFLNLVFHLPCFNKLYIAKILPPQLFGHLMFKRFRFTKRLVSKLKKLFLQIPPNIEIYQARIHKAVEYPGI